MMKKTVNFRRVLAWQRVRLQKALIMLETKLILRNSYKVSEEKSRQKTKWTVNQIAMTFKCKAILMERLDHRNRRRDRNKNRNRKTSMSRWDQQVAMMILSLTRARIVRRIRKRRASARNRNSYNLILIARPKKKITYRQRTSKSQRISKETLAMDLKNLINNREKVIWRVARNWIKIE
jgi:hypothetical protein